MSASARQVLSPRRDVARSRRTAALQRHPPAVDVLPQARALKALSMGDIKAVGVGNSSRAPAKAAVWSKGALKARPQAASLQADQIASSSIDKPGNQGSAERSEAGAIRGGVSVPACKGPQTSTACSWGISSQPKRAPLRW